MLSWLTPHIRCDVTNDVEIQMLRLGVAVLRRRHTHPTLSSVEDAALGALSRLPDVDPTSDGARSSVGSAGSRGALDSRP